MFNEEQIKQKTYKELQLIALDIEQQSTNLITETKERFSQFISMFNYNYFFKLSLEASYQLGNLRFSSQEKSSGDVTIYFNIDDDFLYKSEDISLFSIIPELSFSSTSNKGFEFISEKSSFFIETYTIVKLINDELQNKESGLTSLLTQFYFQLKKLKNYLSIVHSQMNSLKNKKVEELKMELSSSSIYSKVNENEILVALKNGNTLSVLMQNISIQEDTVFNDEPSYSIVYDKFNCYRDGNTYYVVHHGSNKKSSQRYNKVEFLEAAKKMYLPL